MTRQSVEPARAELVRAYVAHWDPQGQQTEELAAVARALLATITADAEEHGRRLGAADAYETARERARTEYRRSLGAATTRLLAALATITARALEAITPTRKDRS